MQGSMNFIVSCQSYEGRGLFDKQQYLFIDIIDLGGIAGTPGSEAHGGYTFCGLAAALLIEQFYANLNIDVDGKQLDYDKMLVRERRCCLCCH
jgi:prenyltransferase beta subunit